MRIWFIGLGLMGIPMAKNILSAWGDLIVWNRTPERANELVSLGARLAHSKQEIAEQCDIIITMVTAGEDVDEILFSHENMSQYITPGSIVIDMSTIWLAWALEIRSKLQKGWVHFLDAPVTGSTPKAITGELTIFIGGDMDIYERVRPILSMMWTNLQYMWGVGSWQAMKLVNNALVAYSMIWLSEVMRLSGAMGLSPEQVAQVIKTLPVSSNYTNMKVDNLVRDEYPMMFSLANMTKDITLAASLMQEHHLSLPMLELAKQLYTEWCDRGYGDLDVSAIGKVL